MWQTLVGVIACAGVVLQQLLVPLHLAGNDHVYLGSGERHVHSHGELVHVDTGPEQGAGHGHAHSPTHAPEPRQGGEPDSEHRPHPVSDHAVLLAKPTAPLILLQAALAPPVHGEPFVLPNGPRLCLAESSEAVPRPPPPRDAAAPRAPPVVV
jgi:hypothetical protein